MGAYASVALVCAGSLLVGHAILALCGHPKWTWLSGPVGFAAILVMSGVAIKLGGHGTSVEVIFGLLVLASAVVVAPRWRIPDTRSVPVLLTAALALLVASIPFIANQRVGILGVGLVNDDMANHLLIADWLKTHVGDMPVLIHQGYPVGPHALVAGLSKGLGTGLVEAFAGLTLAIPVLTAAVAFEALRDLRPAARVVAAVLVAMPYLAAAYLAQEAFKEPIEALFLLSFALLLPAATSPRRAVPLAVIAAGATYVYSFPGLFWLAAAAAIYLGIVAIAQKPDPRAGEVEVSDSPPAEVTSGQRTGVLISVAVGVGVLAVLTAPEWTRMIDFGGFRAFSTSNLSGGLGNLRHQLSPLEAFGIWPTSEFRLAASDSSHPAAFYAGGVIAAAALVVGLPRWFRRYGPALPAALAAAVLGWVGARLFGTVYTSAKALAIAAPLIALVSFGGLLAEGEPRRRTMAAAALAAILAAGMALSTFLVLRQTPVAPTDHANQLGELRPMVQGQKVLFLGRDNFIAYELRGSRPFTAVRNYYDPHYVKPDLRLKDVFRKFDFDSVHPKTLDRFAYVITTSAAYASGPPPNFEAVHETADFVLWKRTGSVGPRRTLAEGDDPGVRLACPSHDETKLLRNGRVTVFAKPPVVGGRWSPGSTVESGGVVTQSLDLPPGRWEISLQYDATQPLRVSAPGFDATVPANLDYRGSVPYYPVGVLTVKKGGPVRFSVQEDSPPFLGRVLGTKAQAHLGAIAASPAGPGGPIPGEAEDVVSPRDACGRYVDSYSPAGSR